MQLLAMRALIIKKHRNDITRIGRTNEWHRVGINGRQCILRLTGAIDRRRRNANLAHCEDSRQDDADPN